MNKKQEEELLDTVVFIKDKVVSLEDKIVSLDDKLTKFQSETTMQFTGIMQRLDHELDKRGRIETRIEKLETKVFGK